MLNFRTIYPWLLFVFIGTFASGTTFYWIKIALREISSYEVAAWRFTFGAIFLWIVAFFAKPHFIFTRHIFIVSFVFGMLMMVIPISLLTWAEIYIPSSLAGILMALTPLMTVLLGILFPQYHQKTSPTLIIGLLIGFVGVLLILLKQLSAASFSSSFLAEAALLLAALTVAFATLYGKNKSIVDHVLLVTIYSSTISAIVLWAFALIATSGNIILPFQDSTWLAVSWLGIIGSGISFFIYLNLIKLLGPARTSSVTYLFSLTAFLLGVIFLGEEYSLREIMGGILIMLGIYVSRK